MYAKLIRKQVGSEGQTLFAQHYYKKGIFAIFTAIIHVKKLLDIYIIFFPE